MFTVTGQLLTKIHTAEYQMLYNSLWWAIGAILHLSICPQQIATYFHFIFPGFVSPYLSHFPPPFSQWFSSCDDHW